MGKLYRGLAAAVRTLSPRMRAEWEEPFDGGACVFVCNHCGALGPIDICVKFPLRESCHVWCNEGIMNRKTCPAYVRQDYWWKPGCRMEPLYNATLPYLAAAVLPPVLKSAPTIPVYHDARVMTTMRQSLRFLKEGEQVVIFPEQPSGYLSHHDWINTGWLNITTLYHRATGKPLRMYPVHIDTHNHVFRIARPIAVDPARSLEEQTPEIVEARARGLRGETKKAAEGK